MVDELLARASRARAGSSGALEARMTTLAAQERFEEAALARDRAAGAGRRLWRACATTGGSRPAGSSSRGPGGERLELAGGAWSAPTDGSAPAGRSARPPPRERADELVGGPSVDAAPPGARPRGRRSRRPSPWTGARSSPAARQIRAAEEPRAGRRRGRDRRARAPVPADPPARLARMDTAVILEGARTPIGKFLGSYAETTDGRARHDRRRRGDAPRGRDARGRSTRRSWATPGRRGTARTPAGRSPIRAGVPVEVCGYNVNIACGSGMKALQLGAQQIALGDAEVVLVGGMENMTRVPFLLPHMRLGHRLGNAEALDAMYADGLLDPLCGLIMGETAENLVDRYDISREEQDAFALESQQKAAEGAARRAAEMIPVEATLGANHGHRGGRRARPRPDTTMASLAKLAPVFREGGSVTAGNSSGLTDGGAAMVLMREARATAEGREPLARVVGWSWAGVPPEIMGIGPVPATQKVLERTGLTMADIDLIEINEAFAAQVLACERELKFDRDKLNVRGGGISLGHPIGMSGARIILSLAYEMRHVGAEPRARDAVHQRRSGARGRARARLSSGRPVHAHERRGVAPVAQVLLRSRPGTWRPSRGARRRSPGRSRPPAERSCPAAPHRSRARPAARPRGSDTSRPPRCSTAGTRRRACATNQISIRCGSGRWSARRGQVAELHVGEVGDGAHPKNAHASSAPITITAASRNSRSPRLILPGCIALKPIRGRYPWVIRFSGQLRDRARSFPSTESASIVNAGRRAAISSSAASSRGAGGLGLAQGLDEHDRVVGVERLAVPGAGAAGGDDLLGEDVPAAALAGSLDLHTRSS